MFWIPFQQVDHGVSGFLEGSRRVAQISVIAHRRRKHVEGHPASVVRQSIRNRSGLIDIVARKSIDENGPGIIAVIVDLAPQHVFGLADPQAGLIDPHTEM